MNCSLRSVLIALSILLMAHRSPAPIQELPESPTPKPQPSSKLKPHPKVSESKIKPEAKPSATPTLQGPVKFAGLWNGKIFRSGSGNTDPVTVTVNAAATSATVSNFFPGPQTGRTTIIGNTMAWNWMLAKWTMTVSADGKTAQIVGDSPFEKCRGTLEKSGLSQ